MASIALGLASANTYPNCEPDNCFRNLVDTRFENHVVPFCYKFLSSHVTDEYAIPEDYNNCAGDVKAVSSACSCITYSHSTTSSVPHTYYPPTTTSYIKTPYHIPAHPTAYPLTTSTIYATKVYTVVGCPHYVKDCPAGHHVTTETYVLSTTICPVATPVVSVPVYHNTTLNVYTPYTPGVKTTATASAPLVQYTSGAGRLLSAEGVIAAAGVAAIAFIL